MKVIRIIFLAVIFAALLVPGGTMLVQSDIPDSISVSAIESWINNKIGFRSAFITAYGIICETLFHTNPRNS